MMNGEMGLITLILEFKWHILFFSEIAGWVLTPFLFFARYFFQSTIFTWVFIILIAMSDYLPSILLPILDAIYTSSLKDWIYGGGLLLNVVIILLFVFSMTLGKKFVLKIDKKIMDFTSNIRGSLKRESDR